MDSQKHTSIVSTGGNIIRENISNLGNFNECKNFINKLSNCAILIWDIGNINAFDDKTNKIISSFAINTNLIQIEFLLTQNIITQEEFLVLNQTNDKTNFKKILLEILSQKLKQKKCSFKSEFVEFKLLTEKFLEDFLIYFNCKKILGKKSFTDWPNKIKFREQKALQITKKQILSKINEELMLQFFVKKQLRHLSEYAQQKGIYLCSSVNFEIEQESCEAWANQNLFFLDNHLSPIILNGNTTKLVTRINKMHDNDFDLYKRIIKFSPFDCLIIDDVFSLFKINEKAADQSITQTRLISGKPEIILANIRNIIAQKLVFFQPSKFINDEDCNLAMQNQLLKIDQNQFKLVDITELRPVQKPLPPKPSTKEKIKKNVMKVFEFLCKLKP